MNLWVVESIIYYNFWEALTTPLSVIFVPTLQHHLHKITQAQSTSLGGPRSRTFGAVNVSNAKQDGNGAPPPLFQYSLEGAKYLLRWGRRTCLISDSQWCATFTFAVSRLDLAAICKATAFRLLGQSSDSAPCTWPFSNSAAEKSKTWMWRWLKILYLQRWIENERLGLKLARFGAKAM